MLFIIIYIHYYSIYKVWSLLLSFILDARARPRAQTPHMHHVTGPMTEISIKGIAIAVTQ